MAFTKTTGFPGSRTDLETTAELLLSFGTSPSKHVHPTPQLPRTEPAPDARADGRSPPAASGFSLGRDGGRPTDPPRGGRRLSLCGTAQRRGDVDVTAYKQGCKTAVSLCNEVLRVHVTCPDETVPAWVFSLRIIQQLSPLVSCRKGSSCSVDL